MLMMCAFCGHGESKVIDSRPTDEGKSIRRRRECLKCSRRFTTYETIETIPIIVIKKDGERQAFSKNKLLNSLLRACEKRIVSLEVLEKAATEIEGEIHNSLVREITAEKIGQYALDKLWGINRVAYVRFASVYRKFDNLEDFMNELSELLQKSDN